MELADGAPPYLDVKPMSKILFKIVHDNVPPIADKWSPEFKDFVAKCLDKNPITRWDAERLCEHPFLKVNDDAELE